MEHTAYYWIEKLGLEAHPEGGYYREMYRSQTVIKKDELPDRFSGDRSFATSIYFLLEGSDFSSLHRIKSDELWHFYAGTALDVYVIHPDDGRLEVLKLGPRFDHGETFKAVVPHGAWFGAKVSDPDSFALVGCTVSPGFDFEDFELAEREKLLAEFPQHEELIKMLTR